MRHQEPTSEEKYSCKYQYERDKCRNVFHERDSTERTQPRRAGDVNANAELTAPTAVGSGDLCAPDMGVN
jgi:hypothetical protein